jgi:hypothetical protein
MSFVARVKGRIKAGPVAFGPRIAVFGDSHSVALLRAQQYVEGQYDHIRVFRLRKEKSGKLIGDAELSDFCQLIRNFTSSDFVFSAVGGNQYAVVSTVRGTVEYDFLASPTHETFDSNGAQLVPYRAIAGYIEEGIRGTIAPVLQQIRASTAAKVCHLAPPPPKEDNSFIAAHYESRFASEGLQDLGPTRPELRLKCWRIQLRSLATLCSEMGIQLVKPPAKALSPGGYLAPRFYANDVTHANRRYGESVLRQISKMTGTFERAQRPS